MFDRLSVIFLAVVTALYALFVQVVNQVPTLIALYIVWRVLVRLGYV